MAKKRVRKSPKSPLFKQSGIELPPVKLFKADDEFVVGQNSIGWMSEDFKKVVAGVTERNIGKAVLKSQELARPAQTKEIIQTIGKRGSISLAHLKALLASQTKSFLAVVYMKGKLWLVNVYRLGGGWDFYASPLDCPFEWSDGNQVFSQVR